MRMKSLVGAMVAACLFLLSPPLYGGETKPPPDPKLAERYLNEVYRDEFRRAHEDSRIDGLGQRAPDFNQALENYDAYTKHQEERVDRQQSYLEERNTMEDRLRRAPRGSETERQARQDLWDLYDRQARDQPLFQSEPSYSPDPLGSTWP